MIPSDPALIQFTGGTTGKPKGAVLTHFNIVAAAFQVGFWSPYLNQMIPLERRSQLSVIPFFHVYGNVIGLSRGMINGYTQIIVPRFEIDEVLRAIAESDEITMFPSVPTMINAMLNHPDIEKVGIQSKIKFISSGAAPLPVEIIDQIEDLGIFFTEGYGLSETSSVAMVTPMLGLKKPASIGYPLPDNDVRLVDLETGEREVDIGNPGEIVIKGPTVMNAYWGQTEETESQLQHGWLKTGDIAIQDEDNCFFIVDRKKDMIIAGGYNIYPREIDEILYHHPHILEAVTIGIPDDYRGETVKSFIILKPGKTAGEEEIIAYCRQHLAAYKVPRIIEIRESLPKSAMGKLLRKELRNEAQNSKVILN